MNNLKTLKDFEPDITMCHKEDLKKEAISYIKELRLESIESPNDKICDIQLFIDDKKRENNAIGKAMHDSVRRETQNYILEKWIKNFFNITEEDLK